MAKLLNFVRRYIHANIYNMERGHHGNKGSRPSQLLLLLPLTLGLDLHFPHCSSHIMKSLYLNLYF